MGNVIFLSQKQMAKELGRFVHKLGGDSKAFVNFWSAIFLPGTIIHEVSHFLVAAMCGLRTGRVEVLPEFIDAVKQQGYSIVRLDELINEAPYA